jgi:hypothetical protein
MIVLGSGGETSLSQFPNNIVIDRCYIHGDPTVGGRRGVALNSASTAVIDSYVSDWKDSAGDSQALAGWNTPGPLKIVNNYLEASTENFILGGSDPSIANLVPSDIEIRGNRFSKPVAWRTQAWTSKNLMELKNSSRTLVEGNIFEYHYVGLSQFFMTIKSVNQANTAPWSVTQDFTFRHNLVRHTPGGIALCGITCDGGFVTTQGGRYLIQNNLFYDMDGPAYGGNGQFLQITFNTPDAVFNHNTVLQTGNPFFGGSGTFAGFQFTDNIEANGPYGWLAAGTVGAIATLNTYFPGSIFTKNAIVNNADASQYPPNNFFPAAYANMVFVDLANNDYRLGASSPYKNISTDGRDIGANVDAINAATACALNGQCGTPLVPPALINDFAFVEGAGRINVIPGSVINLAPITITGTNFTLPASISIVGGAYSVGCTGNYISNVGMISSGQQVCVQHTAVPALNTSVTTTLFIGGKSTTFTSTTTSTPLLPGDDTDGDQMPNAIESQEGTNPFVKDNDIFNNARWFAMQQYRDFLAREGDANGIAFWTQQINSGTKPRDQMVDTFFNSTEFQSVVAPVVRLYFAYFLRIPDYAGLTYWIGQARAGTALAAISANFATSTEFVNRYGTLTNSQFVSLVYQNVLGRAADAAGLAYWTGLLNAGTMTRGTMMMQFSEGAEFGKIIGNQVYVTMIYVGMLRRSPDQTGFNFWVAQKAAGNSTLPLIDGFLAAPEYRARFLP